MTKFEFSPLSLSEGREAVKFCDDASRMPTLLEIDWRMEMRDWLTLLGEQWESCDNIGLFLVDLWDSPFSALMEDPLEWRDAMMTESERSALARLPEEVTVFRGCYAHNKRGLSWSLDSAVAAKFPLYRRYRQEGQPLLIRAKVRRDDILALKLDREEQEVIAERPKIEAIRHIRVPSEI